MLIDQSFLEGIADHIKQQVQYEGSEGHWDKPWWKPTASSKFSVSSACNL